MMPDPAARARSARAAGGRERGARHGDRRLVGEHLDEMRLRAADLGARLVPAQGEHAADAELGRDRLEVDRRAPHVLAQARVERRRVRPRRG